MEKSNGAPRGRLYREPTPSMKFQVPQFIETEAKLVGQFTLKQFLWIAFGTVLIYVLFLALPSLLFFILGVPIGAIFASLAFITINGTPLFNYVAYAFSYLFNPKKYVYKKFETPNQNYSSDIYLHNQNQ